MPIRCAITVGNFSMSSHLSAQANTSTLRFIFEECGLFLSEKAPPRHGTASSAPVDLKRDYVNVINLGLFELSLKTNDKVINYNRANFSEQIVLITLIISEERRQSSHRLACLK